jgi:hypothetical protein
MVEAAHSKLRRALDGLIDGGSALEPFGQPAEFINTAVVHLISNVFEESRLVSVTS